VPTPETQAFIHHILHIINSAQLACIFNPFGLFSRLAGQNLLYELSYQKKPIYYILLPPSLWTICAHFSKRDGFVEQQHCEEVYATGGMHMHNKERLDVNTKRKLDLQSLSERFNTLDRTVFIRTAMAHL
jgi:hypothetical protein